MTLKLTGREAEQLSQALVDAFTAQGLARMVRFKLSRKLEAFTGYGNGADLEAIVFELVGAAERGGWLGELVMGAREAAPGNALLLAFTQPLGLTSLGPRELERIIRPDHEMLEPGLFREQLGAHEPRVCRIETTLRGRSGFGTGFLITPDVVMTNFHVVEALVAAGSNAGAARFDYRNLYQDGKLIRTQEGRRVAFHEKWLVDSSPNSGRDGAPVAECLDYALVRLAEAAGNDSLNGAVGAEARRRGWVRIPRERQTYEVGSPIYILQHPSAEPLKLAMDKQLGLFEGSARVRYTTNTERGSSGSPCFTQGWVLTALHHSGDPDFDAGHEAAYNEGMPIGGIVEMMRGHGVGGVLGENERGE